MKSLKILAAAATLVNLAGCFVSVGGGPNRPYNYVRYQSAPQVVVVPVGAVVAQPLPMPPPGAIFRYGSRVACPQIPIGNGMARCQ